VTDRQTDRQTTRTISIAGPHIVAGQLNSLLWAAESREICRRYDVSGKLFQTFVTAPGNADSVSQWRMSYLSEADDGLRS